MIIGEILSEHEEPDTMESIKELADEIYRERVLRARRTPIEQKILAGPELFELACEFTRAGIRHQNPGVDEAQVEAMLRERLALARRLGL
jgi:hypothetical protein